MTAEPSRSEPPNPWDDLAFVATYERWGDPQTGAFAEVAADRAGLCDGMRVVDVGTGLGVMAVQAAERGCSVLAFDSSESMVRRAGERLAGFADSQAVQMDARAFDLDDDSFDAAFACFSVTLMPHRDVALHEMVRVVRPGGVVCVLNWATQYGYPGFEILIRSMQHLDLLPAAGVDQHIVALEASELVAAGCVEVTLESVEAPAQLPAPASFLDELSAFFQPMIPGFADLSPAQRAKLQSHVAREVVSGAPWKLEATLGTGRVAAN